jgi:hypothetical protein
MADEINVQSNNQSGGVTTGNITIHGNQYIGGNLPKEPENKKQWKIIVKWGSVILGSILTCILIVQAILSLKNDNKNTTLIQDTVERKKIISDTIKDEITHDTLIQNQSKSPTKKVTIKVAG